MGKYKNLDEALLDVEARFLNNLPESQLTQADRLFFQIEQAWWFYEDFIVPDSPLILPKFSKLKTFAKEIFAHCVLLAPLSDQWSSMFDDFNSYKSTIPVCGSIILNKSLDKLLLCKSYKGNSWSFPRGKINQDEDVFDCAMRETLEETGFDCWEYANRHDYLTHFENETKKVKLFIVPFVDEDYPFAPLTRCEISSISFHYLDDLPKGCFGVYPFISKLKRWINGRGASVMKRRKGSAARSRSVSRMEAASIQASKLEKARSASVTTILKRKATKGRSGSESRKENGSLARDFDKRNELTFDGTTSKSWNVADMFAANAKLTGSEYAYDGSSQNFGSYHPRYMNYNDIEAERSKNTAAVNASMKRDMLLSVLLKGTKVSGISSNNNGAGDDSDKIATDANPNGNMCSSLGDGLQRHCAAASIIFGDLGKNNASVSRDVVIGAILGDLFEGAASLDTKAILAAWD